ncbi:MAG TPA: AAA family ATPase [Fimbriiglobus sp.]|jgi:ABC-type cobalamin/Fe3+-siderophores transport system ATPase subunit
MEFSFQIPRGNPTKQFSLTISVGEMLFILGANGTGKSSLLLTIASRFHGTSRRIAAHRQTWFDSGSPDLTGKTRANVLRNIKSFDRNERARWSDNHATERNQVAIYDLINTENIRARAIAHAVDCGDSSQVEKLRAKESAFKAINRILRLANLDIILSVDANDEIMATRNCGNPFSITRLSDGERNAILLAADVLTVPPGTLLLIDEPERHLHRSIISPLLSRLLRERPDCIFVVSTHEPLLPIDNPKSKVLLMRGCVYDEIMAGWYEFDLLDSTDAIDDDLKRTILGERRKILFVEGTEQSLDKPLYSLLFPNASIVAKANCRDIENAVMGIKGASGLHWLKPFGLVDNDSSDPVRIAELKRKGVIPLNVYSVESIYYHPELQKMAGEKHTSAVGGNLNDKLARAKEDALDAIRQNATHLSNRIAEKAARAKVFTLLPKKDEISTGGKRSIELDYESMRNEEANRLNKLIEASNINEIMKLYPIRESPALNAIIKALGFVDQKQYEDTVLKKLVDDPEAVTNVRALLGDLPADLVD